MEVSRLDYFAANAPEVPDWYRLKVESEDAFDSNAFFDKHSPQRSQISEAVESLYQSEIFNHKKRLQIKIYFGWRKYYAEQMVKMLPIDGSGDEVTGD